MPIYEFHCSTCAHYQEELQGMNDQHQAYCAKCGQKMDRIFFPAYLTGDLPQTKGTVMGWDEHLGCEIRGKKHHQEVMEQRGVQPYEPDPTMQAYRDKARYAKKHLPAKEASAAAAKIYGEAVKTRREKAVKEKVRAAMKDI